jgi:flavin-dependent dehydrogenase
MAAFEVAILGGGPAGCATALALVQRGIRPVLLVEGRGYDAVRIGETLPPEARAVLERLGLWPGFLAEKHEPCLGSCSSWGEDALGYNDFLFNPLGNGWHLDRRRFDAFLARRAARCGAQVRGGMASLVDGAPAEGGFRLGIRDGGGRLEAVEARFVVDATGAHASFARAIGARKVFVDQLQCVIGFFQMPSSAGFPHLTVLEAVEYGWWYAARLPEGRIVVAAASDPQLVKAIGLHRRQGWRERLDATAHLAPALAGCRLIGDSVRICGASSFLLEPTAGQGWLAVGDAASAYDPIASRGICKALLDGERAAQTIAACRRGDDEAPERYRSAVAGEFAQYLEGRRYFYAMEKRWPASAFWTNRRARGRLSGGAVRAAPSGQGMRIASAAS